MWITMIDIENRIIKRNGLSDKELYKALRDLRQGDSDEGEAFRKYELPIRAHEECVWSADNYILIKVTYEIINGWNIND